MLGPFSWVLHWRLQTQFVSFVCLFSPLRMLSHSELLFRLGGEEPTRLVPCCLVNENVLMNCLVWTHISVWLWETDCCVKESVTVSLLFRCGHANYNTHVLWRTVGWGPNYPAEHVCLSVPYFRPLSCVLFCMVEALRCADPTKGVLPYE
jgi:hypothetical protein